MKVEIWSDVVCPWCYIGKRRFEAALERFAHRDAVDVVWRSFQLDPDAPRRTEGNLDAMLARKLGRSVGEAAAMNAQVTELAAGEGLEYRLDRARHGNTFDAHRLLHRAARHDARGAAKERLLRAYFTEGRAIADHDTLVELLDDVGVPAGESREVLSSDAHTDDVRADQQRARRLGIQGVPFFVLGERYGVSGAQSAETLLQALQQTWADLGAPEPVGADDAR